MSFLIVTGPTRGLAQFLLSEYGGKRTTLEDILQESLPHVGQYIVVVMEHKDKDNAAILTSEKEFRDFAFDSRPKTWLAMSAKIFGGTRVPK